MKRLRRRDEDGAAAVEFALVLPFLLLIVFGIIAYGVVFAQSLSLSNSARQAARSGVIEGTTCADVSTLAKDAADTIAMDGDEAAVTILRGTSEGSASSACGGGGSDQPCADQPSGTNVYVRLVYNTTSIVPMVPVPSQLKGKGVFRCEFS
jgi:Flp pilus assembly protein TadG